MTPRASTVTTRSEVAPRAAPISSWTRCGCGRSRAAIGNVSPACIGGFGFVDLRPGKETKTKTKHRHEKRVHTPISEHTSPRSRSTLVFNWLKRSLFFWLWYLTFEQVDGLRDLFTCDLTFEQVDGLYECTYAVELQAWHRASDSWHHPPSHDQHATPSVEQHPV